MRSLQLLRTSFTWRDLWDASVHYRPNDVVIFDGNAYVALTPNTNVAPPANVWEIVITGASEGFNLTVDRFSAVNNTLVDQQVSFPLSKVPRDPSLIRFYANDGGPPYTAVGGFFTYDAGTNTVMWLNQGFTITDTDNPRLEYPT